jgi:hypothetical protein
MHRLFAAPAVTLAALILLAGPALACGGLVAPNGAVVLQRTTTLAAYHEGVEHYVTAFEYAGGGGDNFGSIVPLPGVPTDVRRAGNWTLQRLERETHPPIRQPGPLVAAASAAEPAQVLLQTTVDALDITVLSGGGNAVLDWITAHGYGVSPDAPAMIDFYARRSPVFLAARFNTAAASARGQHGGDGTPIQITIPTPNPWVPLRILSLAKGALAPVQADVYLLTDHAPSVLGLDPGVSVAASEPATAQLLDDLRSDRDSGWVPSQAWLTSISINTPADKLVHDLAVDANGSSRPSPTQAGYNPTGPSPAAVPVGFRPMPAPTAPGRRSHTTLIMILWTSIASVLTLAVIATFHKRRRTPSPGGCRVP